MRVRKLDADDDVMFGEGLNSFAIDTPEAVRLAVLTRLMMGEGEWFLDTDDGTAWRTRVLGKHTQDTRDAVIRARILQTEGVISLVAYNSVVDPATRSFTVACIIDTVYGQATIQEAL